MRFGLLRADLESLEDVQPVLYELCQYMHYERSATTYATAAQAASHNPVLVRSFCALHRRRNHARAFCMSRMLVAYRHTSASFSDTKRMLFSSL